MITISPSLLSANFLNLDKDLYQIKDVSNITLHLDVMDGHFVPNLTFGRDLIKSISQNFNFILDAHLMVSNPDFYVNYFSQLGIHNITFHIEATSNPLKLINDFKKNFPSVGVSLKPNTDITVLDNEILKLVDLVLVMTVEPGFGGQKFISKCLDKVIYLKNKKQSHHFNYEIQVDGGIDDQTAVSAIKAGANNLVAGSFIFSNKNLNSIQAIDLLKSI